MSPYKAVEKHRPVSGVLHVTTNDKYMIVYLMAEVGREVGAGEILLCSMMFCSLYISCTFYNFLKFYFPLFIDL